MINTLQELLEDYARFSCMEDRIDPETSEELQKRAKDYLKQLNELNLLTIPLVIEPTTIERNMLVWFNDDIHEVEFIIDDRIEVKELRSGTVFVATKEELTPVR